MKKYERNYINKDNKDNKDNIPKPLYYNEYFVTEQQNTSSNKWIFLVTILLTIFVFAGSVADIFYSYIKIDNCQDISYFTTLNDWLRVNGVFGICYYFFMVIIIYAFYYNEGLNHINNGYTKMTNNITNNRSEGCEILFRVSSTFFTVIMLLLFAIGSYIYFSYFYTFCKSYSIIVYMWIRLLTGILASIGLIVFINIKI